MSFCPKGQRNHMISQNDWIVTKYYIKVPICFTHPLTSCLLSPLAPALHSRPCYGNASQGGYPPWDTTQHPMRPLMYSKIPGKARNKERRKQQNRQEGRKRVRKEISQSEKLANQQGPLPQAQYQQHTTYRPVACQEVSLSHCTWSSNGKSGRK